MQNHDRMFVFFLSFGVDFVFIFVPEQVKRMACEGDVCRLGWLVLRCFAEFQAVEFSVCSI